MYQSGYRDCPKCGHSTVDFGVDRERKFVYAECEGCNYEVMVPLFDDTLANLRIADIVKLTREAWNAQGDE